MICKNGLNPTYRWKSLFALPVRSIVKGNPPGGFGGSSADWYVLVDSLQFLGEAEGEFDAGDEAGEFVFTAEGTDGVEDGIHFV